jgi:hypothetical protein
MGATWAYPQSKVRTEALIHEERGTIPAVILRLAGVYDDVCHSPPLAHQIQRIYERQLAGHLYSGETSHGQSFVHLEDVVDAIERAVERRAQLPPESTFLIGEPETLSYDELQHSFMRLIHGKSSETHNVPGLIAKVGAWAQDHMPGEDPFIKPWMIDRANDHYALDITRAREVLDWQPRRSLRQTLPKMVAALEADPVGWYREHGLEPPASGCPRVGLRHVRLPDACRRLSVFARQLSEMRPDAGTCSPAAGRRVHLSDASRGGEYRTGPLSQVRHDAGAARPRGCAACMSSMPWTASRCPPARQRSTPARCTPKSCLVRRAVAPSVA